MSPGSRPSAPAGSLPRPTKSPAPARSPPASSGSPAKTDEQIEDCRARIKEKVVSEIQDENYEALLEQTMVPFLKRNVRQARLDQILQRHGLKKGDRKSTR